MYWSDEDESDEGEDEDGISFLRSRVAQDGGIAPPNYEHQYAELEDDVLGDDSSDEEEDFYGFDVSKKGRGRGRPGDDSEGNGDPPFMFFDFRQGQSAWYVLSTFSLLPSCVHYRMNDRRLTPHRRSVAAGCSGDPAASICLAMRHCCRGERASK